MNQSTDHTIVLAGGGTAGHVEPALAIARAWKVKHPQDHCVFLGTPSGLENTLVPEAGFELCNIDKVVMPRKLSLDLVKLPIRLLRAVNSAKRVIDSSDLLVGFGGYLSASAYLGAVFSRTPIVIHEANAKVGWANRLGAIFTKNLAIARSVNTGRFSRATVTGMPLRQDVKDAYALASQDWRKARAAARAELGWDTQHRTLLIIGGSQGSTFINSQIAAALPLLKEKGIQILHSVGGGNDLPSSFQNYRAVPYINDMATAYLAADVVLARSGAVTCAEFAALGKMAVFVPLPIGNGEQARNADHLVAVGRAVLVDQKDFSAQWILDNIDDTFEKSKGLPDQGSNQDMGSEERILALMETAMLGKRR